MVVLLLGALLVLGLAAALGVWAVVRPYQGYPTPEKFLQVERGDGSRLIAHRLQENGVVSSARLFYLYLILSAKAGTLKAGEYRFAKPMSTLEVAAKLSRGEIFFHKITIPEGLIFDDVKQILLQQGFGEEANLERGFRNVQPIHDLDPQASNLEGYLFPETYLLSRGTTEAGILGQMVQNFRKRFDASRLGRARELGLSVRQIVTLASLIEKETAIDEERFLVSSVYHNRLKRGMLLECDPTVIYAARLFHRWDGLISRSDLRLDSPYNTYKYPGLPAGPISNPGMRSLDAALHPADTGYLYFVLRNDGHHVFSKSLAAHSRAVAQYRRSRPASRNQLN